MAVRIQRFENDWGYVVRREGPANTQLYLGAVMRGPGSTYVCCFRGAVLPVMAIHLHEALRWVLQPHTIPVYCWGTLQEKR